MSSDKVQQQAPDSPLDDPSSLRAAALSTLKAKRKKPSLLAARIGTVPEAIHLNYGQEDSPTDYSTAAADKQDQQTTSETMPREEGEISESENASPSSMQSTPNRSKRQSFKKEPVSPREPLVPFTQSSIQSRQRTPSNNADTNKYGLFDAYHVRPGLALTQSQYDMSKDIVLDLLGWGVPPDYLLTCGLSREIIYYVFKELNLRLPGNINTNGLPPYPLPTDIADRIRAGFEPTTPYSRSTPTHPSPNRLNRPLKLGGVLKSFASSPTTSSDTPSPSNLADMEQQRRQELLARKAVIASRKNKLTKENSVGRTEAVDAEMSIAPSPSVDDFLKTISPVVLNKPQQPTKAEATVEPSTSDAMEVDLPPGLSPVPPRQNKEPAPASTPTISPSIQTSFPDPGSSTSVASVEGRRGTKRPVAADFVDMDTQMGDTNTSYLPRNARRRPKLNGFAGVGSIRRCVIDLSDSEGEAEDAALYGVSPTEPTVKTFGSRTRSLTPTHSMLSTPIPPALSEPASIRTMSPAALVEKETEIRKMREMIAQRELLRQKKLGNASKPSINGNSPAPLVAPSPVTTETNEETNAKSGDNSPPSASTSEITAVAATDIDPEPSQDETMTDANENTVQSEESAVIEPADVTRNRTESDFTCYISPLQGYNLSTGLSSKHSLDSSSSSSFRGLIDLEAFKVSQIDPSKRLCHYEVPGGGVCRDNECEDVHLSRIDDDIDDEMLASYLCAKLQDPNLDRDKLVEALQAQDPTETSLEDRVDRALSRVV